MDLISREAVTDIIQKEMESVTDYLQHDVLINVEFEVCELPTVEAKEVVHGEWIFNQYYTWECGNCGFRPFKGYIQKEPGFNYCPNCGCDMRGENSE